MLHGTTLVVIAAAWLFAWRVGYRWVRGCGVNERAARWALACIPPTAGLILSVHVIALAALLSGRGWLAPEPVAVVFVVVTLAASRVQRSGIRDRGSEIGRVSGGPSAPGPRSLGWWWLPVLIVAGMYAVFLLDALTRYPSGYDGLNYHLPSAVRWTQERCIDLIVGLFHESLPENGMIVACLLGFARLECLLPVTHLPAAVVVALAIYSLARAAGGSRKGAMACGCIALSIPIVVFQSFSSYIDLYAAAAWLAALLAITWATRTTETRQRHGLLLLAGLSAGVALGSKSTYLALVPMLGVIVMAMEWLRPRAERRGAPAPFRNLAIFGLATLVCSGFWFVRGTVRAGNPVYPLTFEIGGQKVLPGFLEAGDNERRASFHRSVGTRLRHWWDYPWRERKYGTGYRYGVDNGLGAAYATFVPLGLLAAVLSTRLARVRSVGGRWRFVFLLLAGSGGVLLVTVFGEHLRFALPLLLISVPAAVAFLDRLMVRFPRSMLAALTVALMVTAAVATLKPAQAFAGRVRDGNWDRSGVYEIPALIDQFEPGTRIVNLGARTLNYPLLGSSLSNLVISAEHWNLMLGGERISAQALRRHAIDYVFVQAPWPQDWPDDLPIRLVYDSAEARAPATTPPARLYQVRGVTIDD